jgi:hypothetical protein
MKKKFTCFICLCIPLLCMAQALPRQYDYDAAGNRTLRKVVQMLYAPPVPIDSLQVTSYELQELKSEQFFVENIAQTEIKIYPNPTTEKITLDIAGWETLQTGIFKLYTMTGQLLQERLVHAVTTEVSLAGLARGTYILKVQINDRVEDWKIIKN